MNRRELLEYLAASVALNALSPVALGADAKRRPRLVLLNLRGGLDGLAVVAPYGDPDFNSFRGQLTVPPPGSENGLLKLDGLFGLHPRLQTLYDLYRRGEAVLFHAVATPYRSRSHFDAQKILENGTSDPGEVTGWLNRAAGVFPDLPVLSIGSNVPLIVRGQAPIQTWAPSALPQIDDDTLRRIRDLYSNDPFFAERLEVALDGPSSMSLRGRQRGRRGQLQAVLDPLIEFLTRADGPMVIALDWGGWDTHANQGGAQGPLANRLGQLDDALATISAGTGRVWDDTVMIVFTEFGRTVSINGTNGTDHGTGTLAFAVGGAVSGGRLIADWPGLSPNALLDGRDLKPTRDIRDVFAGALVDHLGFDQGLVENDVFPGAKLDPITFV